MRFGIPDPHKSFVFDSRRCIHFGVYGRGSTSKATVSKTVPCRRNTCRPCHFSDYAVSCTSNVTDRETERLSIDAEDAAAKHAEVRGCSAPRRVVSCPFAGWGSLAVPLSLISWRSQVQILSPHPFGKVQAHEGPWPTGSAEILGSSPSFPPI